MNRLSVWGLLTALLWFASAPAAAHEIDVLYDRRDPVVVPVHYRKMVTVAFWEVVAEVNTTIPESALEIIKDDTFPDMIKLANVAPKTRGMVYVTTVSGTVVHLNIRHWGPTRQKINVKDARTEAQRALSRVLAQTELSPDERAVRDLWRAMWGFPASPLVQVQTVHRVLETTPERQVILVRRYETAGFYGFTQQVRNLSREPLPLHPATITVDCPLFSVALDGHKPPVPAGGDPHQIAPGGSVLVHLTCKGGSRAEIR